MKKCLLLCIMMLMSCICVYGANDISVVIDGTPINFENNQPPIIQNGTTLVPFRAVLEEMGAFVEWDKDLQLCQASIGGINVSTTIGDRYVYVDEDILDEANAIKKIEAPVPAQIINNRTMVPLRVFSEGLGFGVDWNNVSRTVSISTGALKYAGKYAYTMEEYTSKADTEDGTTYITASANYPQFKGDGVIEAINTQLDNTFKKDIDSFVESYKEDALTAYTTAAEHLFEPPYNYFVNCEVSENNIAAISINYYENKYNSESNVRNEVIKINLETGEVVE